MATPLISAVEIQTMLEDGNSLFLFTLHYHVSFNVPRPPSI